MFVPGIMAHRASGPTYAAEAVTFDGTNDYLTKTTGVTGMTDNKTFTFSSWFFVNSSSNSNDGFISGNTPGAQGAAAFNIHRQDSSDKIVLKAGVHSTTEGTHAIKEQVVSNTVITKNTWHHLLISMDAATGTFHLYLDDVDDSAAPTVNNLTVDWTVDNYSAAGTYSGFAPIGSFFYGDLADEWFDTTYMDFSVTANRRKFISATKKPVDLGTDGSTPTGSSPDIFFTGDEAAFVTNQGTMGAFTENGTITNSSNEPVEV